MTTLTECGASSPARWRSRSCDAHQIDGGRVIWDQLSITQQSDYAIRAAQYASLLGRGTQDYCHHYRSQSVQHSDSCPPLPFQQAIRAPSPISPRLRLPGWKEFDHLEKLLNQTPQRTSTAPMRVAPRSPRVDSNSMNLALASGFASSPYKTSPNGTAKSANHDVESSSLDNESLELLARIARVKWYHEQLALCGTGSNPNESTLATAAHKKVPEGFSTQVSSLLPAGEPNAQTPNPQTEIPPIVQMLSDALNPVTKMIAVRQDGQKVPLTDFIQAVSQELHAQEQQAPLAPAAAAAAAAAQTPTMPPEFLPQELQQLQQQQPQQLKLKQFLPRLAS